MNKRTVLDEIRRVANGAESLTQREFGTLGTISLTTVRDTFGTWNQAVEAAGLLPISTGGSEPSRRRIVSDEQYLQEIIRLTQELGREVTFAEMNAKGQFSVKPYLARWKSWTAARKAAYEKYGRPKL